MPGHSHARSFFGASMLRVQMMPSMRQVRYKSAVSPGAAAGTNQSTATSTTHSTPDGAPDAAAGSDNSSPLVSTSRHVLLRDMEARIAATMTGIESRLLHRLTATMVTTMLAFAGVAWAWDVSRHPSPPAVVVVKPEQAPAPSAAVEQPQRPGWFGSSRR